MEKNNFSIVIPTHTGEEYIADCFEGILKQKGLEIFDLEIIVVIDGPNNSLKEKVLRAQTKFESKNIDFRIIEFPENRGRFEARYEGAKASSRNWLLFIDDRNIVAPDYLRIVTGLHRRALIPNVLESTHPNAISRLLYLVRRRVYRSWGEDFKSYDITFSNFDKSPKGTTSFWVKKSLFLTVCRKLKRVTKNTKDMSDDTRIMRMIIDDTPIYRASEAKIYYQPRSSFWAELKHLYQRGPRFVDYYLNKASPYFIHLLAAYLFMILLVFSISFSLVPVFVVFVAIMAIVFIAGLIVSRQPSDILLSLWVFPLVISAFGLGLIHGLGIKILSRLHI